MAPSSLSLVALSLIFGIDADRGAAAYVVVPPRGVDVVPRPLCGRLRRLRRRGTTTTTTTASAAPTPSDYYPDSDADADADEWEHPPFADGAVGGGGVVGAGSDFYPDDDDIRPYIRIRKRGRHYDVQTAITTFRKYAEPPGRAAGSPVVTVDLHAQIHFGDASYYRYFDDDDAFGSRYDRVLYELIVEDRFLEPSSSSSSSLRTAPTAGGGAPILRRLIPAPSPRGGEGCVNPVASTQADRDTASQYGLQCQVDGIRYCREGWVHADLTREEFLARLESDGVDGGRERRRRPPPKQRGRRPLWALASASSASYPGSELVSSLLRPLATTTAATSSSPDGSAALTRRLFTHLFLPGDALSGWIRAALWLGVPSPELSIMLVDWSSLSHVGRRSRSRRRRGSTGGTPDDSGDGGIAPISPIAAPVLLSLLAGNWGTARRLVFGQVLAAGQSNVDSSRNGVLIGRRNDRAMDVLRQSLSSSSSGRDGYRGDVDGVVDPAGGGTRRVALLYGAGHCRDLHRRLVRTEGMTPVRTEWRTAFRATVPQWGDLAGVDGWVRSRSRDVVSSLPPSMGGVVESMSVSTLESVAVGIVVLPLYMLVGGFDWVSTIGDAESSFRGGAYLDGIAAVLLYLVRHVAMYVGIAKFVVDWGRTGDGIFDDDESA